MFRQNLWQTSTVSKIFSVGLCGQIAHNIDVELCVILKRNYLTRYCT